MNKEPSEPEEETSTKPANPDNVNDPFMPVHIGPDPEIHRQKEERIKKITEEQDKEAEKIRKELEEFRRQEALEKEKQKQQKHKGMFKEIEEGLEPIEEEIFKGLEPINPWEEQEEEINRIYLKPLEDEVVDDLDKGVELIYPDAGEYVSQQHNFFAYLYFFRWVFNLIFVAFPWVFFSQLMIAFNIFFNIWFNQMWADGNWFLVFNTIFLIVETWGSYPLIFELPQWIKHTRLLRVITTTLAFIYASVYLAILVAYLYSLYFEPESVYEGYDMVNVMESMFLAYNLIFLAHIMPVNLMILGKEVSLWFFPMLDTDKDDGLDTEDVADTFNPFSWLDAFRNEETREKRRWWE